VDGRALNRLRLAFVGLGVALLLPLALLVRSAAERLEEQRKLKHQVVAERIFDEMERELAALLEHERARPTSAYGTTQTRVESWDPFVVGYFTRDSGGANVIAGAQLTAERIARVQAAAEAVWVGLPTPKNAAEQNAPAPAGGTAPSIDDLLDGAMKGNGSGASVQAKEVSPTSDTAASAHSPARASRKQEEVLRQLNRSMQQKKAAPSAGKKSSDDYDPLQGLDL
jgi:hypothetical protein